MCDSLWRVTEADPCGLQQYANMLPCAGWRFACLTYFEGARG